MLYLKLFGAGDATFDEHPLPGFPGQQPYLLLCYLVLYRHHSLTRDRLSAIFWGNNSSQTARKCLRNVLWRLRALLQEAGAMTDEYLYISDETISFLPTSDYRLDVEMFENAIAQCRNTPIEQLTHDQTKMLEEMVNLYTGDLLEGIYDDWCLYDRQRLQQMHLDALSKLMIYYGLVGSYERALACGAHLLVCDGTREGIHRRMMWLYWCAGDRGAALAQYKRCLQILQDEMGVEPTAQTRLLYHQMVHNEFDPIAWPIHRDITAASKTQIMEPQMQAVNRMTRQIHHLRNLIREADTELNMIEKQLDEVTRSQEAMPTPRHTVNTQRLN